MTDENSIDIEKLPNIYNNIAVDTYNYEPYNIKEVDTNSSTMTYYNLDGCGDNIKNTMLLDIFRTMISDKFFEKLRTKQQLGYCVQTYNICHRFINHSKDGYIFTIQSSTYDNTFLQERISEYINNIMEELVEDNFKEVVASTIQELSEPPQTLLQICNDNLVQIIRRKYMFDLKEQKINITKTLTFDDLKNFVRINIIENKNRIIINVN